MGWESPRSTYVQRTSIGRITTASFTDKGQYS